VYFTATSQADHLFQKNLLTTCARATSYDLCARAEETLNEYGLSALGALCALRRPPYAAHSRLQSSADAVSDR